jgi:hypothetical protein
VAIFDAQLRSQATEHVAKVAAFDFFISPFVLGPAFDDGEQHLTAVGV